MLHPSHLKTAITAALEAGKVILDIYYSDDFEVELKDDDSPLTKADVAAHHVIMSHLKTTGIPVLSEEGKSIPYEARKDWEQLWIVDPIDGTKEFIKRNGEFTVNIALIENHKPVMGVIFVPVSGDLYFSTLAKGAFKVKVNLDDYDLSKLIVNGIQLPIEQKEKPFTILASRSHHSEKTDTYLNEMRQKHGAIRIITLGSSLKFCLVAEGLADCYPKFGPTMEWDTAAGQAICEHSGVDVINWHTKERMLYNRAELLNAWFLVR